MLRAFSGPARRTVDSIDAGEQPLEAVVQWVGLRTARASDRSGGARRFRAP
jgi:hypothetical protein